MKIGISQKETYMFFQYFKFKFAVIQLLSELIVNDTQGSFRLLCYT